MSFIDEIRSHITGKILEHEMLHRHVWYQIGGPCDYYCIPASVEEISRVSGTCASAGIPLFVLGKGSNLLVSDDGIRGLVLDVSEACIEVDFNETSLRVGAGCYMPKIVLECEKRGLGGVERFAGIPGTVGGVLKMNAGCHGKEIYDVVREVTFLSHGKKTTGSKADLGVTYRHVTAFDEPSTVILESLWDLTPRPTSELSEERKEYMKKRHATQPINLPSSGSVFKNPPGDHAARLIEAAGLKGLMIGGAGISDKHANFIVNKHHASAADVLQLMKKARHEVFLKFGVMLDLEVKLVGFKADETSELI